MQNTSRDPVPGQGLVTIDASGFRRTPKQCLQRGEGLKPGARSPSKLGGIWLLSSSAEIRGGPATHSQA